MQQDTNDELGKLQEICQDIVLAAEVATWRVIYARTGTLPKEKYLQTCVLAETNLPLTRASLYDDLEEAVDALLHD